MTTTTFFFIFIPILSILLLSINLLLAPHNPVVRSGKSKIGDKLSNSGDILKLLIPSIYWKINCGWTNYSCMVTSQKMYESKIGDRGSKSIISIIVKEQRVNGSWYENKFSYLRFTLVGFERNTPLHNLYAGAGLNIQDGCLNNLAKIPSNQINLTRNYSQLPSKFNLNPEYITGFTDGEGCFMLTIIKDKKYKLGWRVVCKFVISLHKKDLSLLKEFKDFFKVGNISFMGEDSIQYRVESLEGLAVIINHFNEYPLITKKLANYTLFKLAFNIIKNKNHLTEKGLLELVALKAELNKGLSQDLCIAFPNIIPVLRLEVPLSKNINPFWLAGFVEAEGCFHISIFKSKTSKYGEAVKLSFILTQNVRDKDLMNSLIEYLGCGYTTLENRGTIDFKVTKFSNIKDVIVPFFKKYPLQGVKSLDFGSFCKAVDIVANKGHLSKEGLDEVRIIKNEMNTNRKF